MTLMRRRSAAQRFARNVAKRCRRKMKPDVSMSQAQMPSGTMNRKSQAPERRQQVLYRTHLCTTWFVDPKRVKEGGVSIEGNGHNIRSTDFGMQGVDGKMGQYNDSITGVHNYYEPSFRSFAMSTYSIAN
ncbi:unnamed protein product [Hyaloperonospora brassicae]|uniref:Uncharacterized protein n=1 Tax=Hyaloperonospora brassicae TaxID=162125 RepID=A0AAV0U264_HYABA|nr:unnamed protein product [Hyaloperonospora brassicae]